MAVTAQLLSLVPTRDFKEENAVSGAYVGWFDLIKASHAVLMPLRRLRRLQYSAH